MLRTTFDNLEMFERLFVQSDEMLCKPSAPTECLVGSCARACEVSVGSHVVFLGP